VTATFEASANQPSGRGDAGNVNIKVTDTVDIAGEKNGFASGIFSSIRTGVEGNGGNITIDSDSFSLRNGSQLVTSTSGQGNAGSILVNASDAITISGTSKESGLSSALFSSNNPNSTGKSGNITANTNLFHIADGALLDARTQNNFMGGDITINTNIFEALNGGQISATALGSGRAGKITVNATKKAIISGSDLSYNHRVTKFPNLVVNLGANSGLFVTSSGSAITGDIEVNSPKIRLDNQAILNAESTSGNGGNINLNSDLLVLRRDSQISTNAGTEKKGGDGGNININSKFIVAVPEENSDITANAFSGTGGKVNINTLSIYGIEVRPQPSDTTNDVTASSELGVQGQISVNNLDIELSKGIIELPEDVLDATNKVAQICSKDSYSKKPLGEFIITGRDNLPPSPLDMTVGNSNIRPLATLDKEEREQKYETQSKQEEQEAKTFIFSVSDDSKATFKEYRTDITEAQDWVKTADGTITLVAQTPNTTPSVSNTNIKCLK
jgi:large exoprotein involved in heme utilization and adhesion